MECEVNAEVSRSHSNEASSSSTTRTIGCFQTFRAIGPNILKCQYQMSSNILKCHILQWSILLSPICLCHNRVCIILICKEVRRTIWISLWSTVICLVNKYVLYQNVLCTYGTKKIFLDETKWEIFLEGYLIINSKIL